MYSNMGSFISQTKKDTISIDNYTTIYELIDDIGYPNKIKQHASFKDMVVYVWDEIEIDVDKLTQFIVTVHPVDD